MSSLQRCTIKVQVSLMSSALVSHTKPLKPRLFFWENTLKCYWYLSSLVCSGCSCSLACFKRHKGMPPFRITTMSLLMNGMKVARLKIVKEVLILLILYLLVSNFYRGHNFLFGKPSWELDCIIDDASGLSNQSILLLGFKWGTQLVTIFIVDFCWVSVENVRTEIWASNTINREGERKGDIVPGCSIEFKRPNRIKLTKTTTNFLRLNCRFGIQK